MRNPVGNHADHIGLGPTYMYVGTRLPENFSYAFSPLKSHMARARLQESAFFSLSLSMHLTPMR